MQRKGKQNKSSNAMIPMACCRDRGSLLWFVRCGVGKLAVVGMGLVALESVALDLIIRQNMRRVVRDDALVQAGRAKEWRRSFYPIESLLHMLH